VALVALAVGATTAAATVSDTEGQTTLEQRVVPAAPGAFRFLQLGPGEPYAVREELGSAGAARAANRTSLTYFGQLSDFQLADEESPARLEVIDPLSTPLSLPFGAAWRPWEALEPQLTEAMIRQVNQFVAASPVADGSGARSAMGFTINTGDLADSQQLNETLWVRTLLEGGALDPNSGVNKATYSHPLCPNLFVPGAAEAARYTGVQDYDDYIEGTFPEFYDPDLPKGAHAAWPKYPGLMDRAQQSFTAAGLDVPSYVAFGNHDALVQGNAAANAAFELVATGCLKPVGPVSNPENAAALLASLLNPANLLASFLTSPQNTVLVPGDPKRQFVSKKQFKDVFKAGAQADGHGFDLIDAAQEAASKGAAGYYAWSPAPGMRFISLDTVAEAGTTLSSNGCGASWKRQPPRTSWWCCSATTRRRASSPTLPTSSHRPACSPTRTATTSTPAATSTRASQPRSICRRTWSTCCTSSRTRSPGSPATRTTTSSTRSRTRAGRAGSGASGSPPRPTGRSRRACSRSSTTTTARSRSSARSSTTSARPPRRRRARSPRAWTSTTSPRRPGRCPSTTSSPAPRSAKAQRKTATSSC
jgi:hypothetical protein